MLDHMFSRGCFRAATKINLLSLSFRTLEQICEKPEAGVRYATKLLSMNGE